MIFQTPNVIPPGGLFQIYQDSTGDTHNDMALVDNHTDNLVHYTHYKYKQTYKGLDVEGAGCIEHFDAQGSLSFVNAKLAVNLNINTKADIALESIMTFFLDQMDSETEFAWNDQAYEERIKYEQNDPNATYYPTPELLIAIDNYKDVHYEIPANRYTLTYKIKVATINPFKITDYYLDANNSILYANGQPDTYLGTNYYSGTDLNVNEGGVHINSGVQNHWFYILSNGASGTNDNGDYYNVPGVGMDDAAEIAYLALTSILQSSSQFTDSRMATIQAAIALFGECSQQHKSTVDAWYAVGIGNLNSCAPLSVSENHGAISMYPNPANTVFSISTEGLDIKSDLYIFDINGQLVKTINASEHLKIDVSDLSGGIYVVKLNVNDKIITKKLIIQSND